MKHFSRRIRRHPIEQKLSSLFKEESGDKAEKPQQIEEKDDEKNEKPKRERRWEIWRCAQSKRGERQALGELVI